MTKNPTADPIPASRCSSKTKTGEPCKGYAVMGGETCVAHTPGLKERSLAAATQASAEARTSAVAARKQESEQAKLSLTERIRRYAALHDAEIVESLGKAAIADGNSPAMRELLARVEGKVTDSLNLNAGDPFTMSQAQLEAWLLEADKKDAVQTT